MFGPQAELFFFFFLFNQRNGEKNYGDLYRVPSLSSHADMSRETFFDVYRRAIERVAGIRNKVFISVTGA